MDQCDDMFRNHSWHFYIQKNPSDSVAWPIPMWKSVPAVDQLTKLSIEIHRYIDHLMWFLSKKKPIKQQGGWYMFYMVYPCLSHHVATIYGNSGEDPQNQDSASETNGSSRQIGGEPPLEPMGFPHWLGASNVQNQSNPMTDPWCCYIYNIW